MMSENFSVLVWNSPYNLAIPALIILLLAIKFIKSNRKSAKNPLNLPPGGHSWPILSGIKEFLTASLDEVPEKLSKDRLEKNEPPVFRSSLMGQPIAVLYGPAGNKFLFGNENKLVTTWWPPSVKKILGKCIANTGGVEGARMRKMVSYFFSPDAFTKLYIQIMDVVAQKHLESHWKGKEETNVFPAVRLYTFEVACRLFMSIKEPTQIANLAALFDVFIKGVISIPLEFPGTRFYKAKRAANAIRKKLQVILKERKVALEQNTAKSSQDLLSHLLACPDETGKFMEEAVIINNILLLLFAGHDTSSSALTMLMKYLAEHPQVYDQVLKEQNEIASLKAGEYLQWEDIRQMKYSWNVASEAMRLSPPLLGSFREAVKDFKYAGYDIPKGWTLYWTSCLTHRDPGLFPEPTEFDPSRYEGAGPAPYSYVPFGGGPRMCLGKEFARLEILIFLHNIVRKFSWKLQIPGERIIYDPIPTPVEGLPIRLVPHEV